MRKPLIIEAAIAILVFAGQASAQPHGSGSTAADQLCRAAGAGLGCIGKFKPSKENKTRLCGATLALDRPMAPSRASAPSQRAAGFPIASSLDALSQFDEADIKANLAASTAEQLAAMTWAVHQETTRLAATIDALRVHLFGFELGASAPLASVGDAAKDTMIEAIKDAVPFWRGMESAGQQGVSGDRLHTMVAYSDDIENAVTARDLSNGALLRALRAIAEKPGSSELARSEAKSLLEGVLAIEDAKRGDKSGASEHAGKSAAALIPASEWLLPEAALPTLVKSQAYLTVSLIAADLLARGADVAEGRSTQKDARAFWQQASLDLAARIEDLKGKLARYQRLERLIADEPRCR